MMKMAEGHMISDLHESKYSDRSTLVLHPCEENPKVAASTNGMAYLEGTREQFKHLCETIAQAFDFTQDEMED
jgi:hypothetical protein